jgi:hypothetical protein
MFHTNVPRRAFLVLTTGAITLLASNAAIAAPDPTPPLTSTEQRDIVPAYFYPDLDSPGSQWKKMCETAATGSIIIMNPDSGPGKKVNPDYIKAISYCQGRGHKVIGYVHTDYGKRSLTKVTSEIDNYLKWYEADGIFLDEMNNNADDPTLDKNPIDNTTMNVKNYYSFLSQFIRQHTADPSGPSQTIVGNPGDVSEQQGPWAFEAVDVLVVFEGTAAKYSTWVQPHWAYPGTHRQHAYRLAHLVHGVSSQSSSGHSAVLARSQHNHAGYVYLTPEVEIRDTSGTLIDPLWNELSPFWFS